MPSPPETDRPSATADTLGFGSDLDTGVAPVARAEVGQLPAVAPDAYEIVAEHARGGMGRVLLAYDRRLGRPVAIKELLSDDAGAAARFVREALITARLQHPSIVPVHEAGRWPTGAPFYAMKLIAGSPLSELIRTRASLAERMALLPVVIAVAEAVAYAHSKRVIHRDLKPANIVVGEFGETIVIDWGLAKDLGAPDESEPVRTRREASSGLETVDGSIIGTPGFMAPEQASGRTVDERADVYALGAILYSLLAGAMPYKGRNHAELVQQVLDGPPPPLGPRQPGIADELLAVVERAMARDPAARYASARELAADLKRFQTGQLVGAHRYTTGALVRRWLSRNRALVAVSAAALAAVAGVAGLSVRRVMRERGVAVAERQTALAERARAEAALAREAERVDELVLAQARGAVEHDPTRALAALQRLRLGAYAAEARVLAEDALTRGPSKALLHGHVGPVAGLAFAPDGHSVASCGSDGTARRWSVPAGSVAELVRAPAELRVLALAPDGRVVLGGADGRVRIVDGRAAPRVLDGAHDAVESLAVAGGRVASGARDGAVQVWQLDDGRLVATLTGRGVARVALSPDGQRLAVRDDVGVRMVALDGGAARPLLAAPLARASGGEGELTFSSDGRWLAAGGAGAVLLWPGGAGAPRRLAVDGTAAAVVFAPDGTRLAAALADGTVLWWTLPDGQRRELAHRGDAARDLRFSPDSRQLVAGRGMIVRLWDLDSGELRKLRGHTLDVTRLAFSPDGRMLASSGLDGTIRLWPTAPLSDHTRLSDALDPADASALAADGTLAVAHAGATSVQLWRPGAPPLAVAAQAPVLRLALSRDGARLATAGADGTVRAGPSNGPLLVVGRHDAAVNDVAFIAGAVVSVGDDGTLRRWPTSGEAAPPALTAHEALVRVAATPDGTRLATAGRDGTLRLWSPPARDGRVLQEESRAVELAFSADGARLAVVAPGSRNVQVWTLAGGAPRTIVEDEEVRRVVFLPGGILALGGAGGALRLVDVASAAGGWSLAAPRAAVVALAAGDPASLAAVSADGTLRRWPVRVPAEPAALAAWLATATVEVGGATW